MNELLDKPLTKNEFYGGMTTLKDTVVAELCTVPEGGTSAYQTTRRLLPSEKHLTKLNRISCANEF